MLDRWAAEDVSTEPDWDADSIEKVRLARAVPDAAHATKAP
jgi:hypothetical protein